VGASFSPLLKTSLAPTPDARRPFSVKAGTNEHKFP
jgi:hypothetical protein